mmetsp:Transcript_8959/g.13310  ORF Transcript_8959/g.13310 Transcript_8959/m.13310 type:complete len:349 (-) Transcript_8959:88-1134(-)
MVAISKASIPRLGLGMAALGRPGYINLNRATTLGSAGNNNGARDVQFMQEKANQVLDEAFRLGMSWIDCARSYGLSEKFVGEYLRSRNISPDDAYVSSKWGYTYVADWNVSLPEGQPHEVKDHSVETFLRQLDETVECLGEYVRLYQIHSATFESGVLTNAKTLAALEECKLTKGWAIGLSVSSPKQGDVLREAMKIQMQSSTGDDEQPLFDSVQCTYNLLEQKAGDALLEAHNSGMSIIVKEGLANGRVLSNPLLLEACKRSDWKSVSEGREVTPDALALACILAQPFGPSVLSGAVTAEQLASNHLAIELAEELKGEKAGLFKDLMEGCKMPSEEYWAERSSLAWN